MKRFLVIMSLWMMQPAPAGAVVFLNEIFINPQGSFDDTVEFIELAGTPGKSLDGYAVALLNGMQTRYWPEGTPFPEDMEIDEFFSLDGLSLGANGLLVIGISPKGNFPTVVSDTSFHCWSGDASADPPQAPLWNGELDTPGKLQNDGSNTILLIRNRPGRTQADPTHPAGLRWGKDIDHDRDFFPHVEDPQNPPPPWFDQWGDGSIDQGAVYDVCVGGDAQGLPCDNGCPGGTCRQVVTLDLRGASTPGADSPEIDDDLEVVDEISYEHERGWEYDLDDRFVDCGVCQGGGNGGQPCRKDSDCPDGTCIGESQVPGLECRRVHTLDDPQGFNPDALTRVDYRTKGLGWAPAAGAYGAYPLEDPAASRTNWQDTATEQWIRGESVLGIDEFFNFLWFYDNAANTNPDAIQPYMTHVPLWLNNGSAPDYDFGASNTYQIKAGQINPLAVPFIPGDANRDGVCDEEDIAMIASVFGNDNWIFSNSYAAAPEGDRGDPATQIRPWDVDATGTHGIEPGDLQWTLNFQGNTTGRIVGIIYDQTGPATTGVHLNPNAGVTCFVSVNTVPLCGRPIDQLRIGDRVELIVGAELVGGANMTAEQENGIMQFVHDILIDSGEVLRVMSVETIGPYLTTRSDIQTPAGAEGDLGIINVNGYTTSFIQGLDGPVNLYRVTLQAIGLGGPVPVSVAPAAENKFVAGTPWGLKIGRTGNDGDPESADYSSATVVLAVTSSLPPDLDGDGDVDGEDIDQMQACALGPEVAFPTGCEGSDLDGDGDVDQSDFGLLQRCISGADTPIRPDCYPCDQ